MASKRTGRRIFSVISIILSALVLLVAVSVIIGTWVARSAAIDTATHILEGVNQIAQAGRDDAARLDIRLTNLDRGIGEVDAAVDQLAQNVEERGLVLVLLPPEKEQELESTAQQISDMIASIKGAVEAVGELKQAIDRIPFVELPQIDPERVQATEAGIESVRSDVEELAADIRDFRENSSAEISRLSAPISRIRGRIETSQEKLGRIDNRLETLQNNVVQLKQRISFYVTTITVANTLLFAWVNYAMVVLIRQALSDLRNE